MRTGGTGRPGSIPFTRSNPNRAGINNLFFQIHFQKQAELAAPNIFVLTRHEARELPLAQHSASHLQGQYHRVVVCEIAVFQVTKFANL
jgi:hypothetical protein